MSNFVRFDCTLTSYAHMSLALFIRTGKMSSCSDSDSEESTPLSPLRNLRSSGIESAKSSKSSKSNKSSGSVNGLSTAMSKLTVSRKKLRTNKNDTNYHVLRYSLDPDELISPNNPRNVTLLESTAELDCKEMGDCTVLQLMIGVNALHAISGTIRATIVNNRSNLVKVSVPIYDGEEESSFGQVVYDELLRDPRLASLARQAKKYSAKKEYPTTAMEDHFYELPISVNNSSYNNGLPDGVLYVQQNASVHEYNLKGTALHGHQHFKGSVTLYMIKDGDIQSILSEKEVTSHYAKNLQKALEEKMKARSPARGNINGGGMDGEFFRVRVSTQKNHLTPSSSPPPPPLPLI